MKDLCVVIPAWNREKMLSECLDALKNNTSVSMEVWVVDDRSTDRTRQVAESYGCNIIDGPGMCNWRPGAIHWPVFQVWLMTKCPFITYLFSDDLSIAPRYNAQLEYMKLHPELSATYAKTKIFRDKAHPFLMGLDTTSPYPGAQLFGGIPTYTESLVIRREPFIAAGGLDYPIHVAYNAEAWIWAAAGAAGKVVPVNADGFYFREHADTLSKDLSSESAKGKAMEQKTGWGAADAARLWKVAEPKFLMLVEKAKKINA